MRVTDDRYTRDRQRLDLAIRMIRHEARTQTIRTWTGLSDDRIRKLYRAYVKAHGGAGVRRHRGRAPTQCSWFLRNQDTRRESAALAGLFALLGLLPGGAARRVPAGTAEALRWGELFCRVYETHRALHSAHRISFEHACHLLASLERRAELALDACPQCGVLMIADQLRARTPVCPWCEHEQRPRPELRPNRAVAPRAAA
jgi:hypothetical protein